MHTTGEDLRKTAPPHPLGETCTTRQPERDARDYEPGFHTTVHTVAPEQCALRTRYTRQRPCQATPAAWSAPATWGPRAARDAPAALLRRACGMTCLRNSPPPRPPVDPAADGPLAHRAPWRWWWWDGPHRQLAWRAAAVAMLAAAALDSGSWSRTAEPRTAVARVQRVCFL